MASKFSEYLPPLHHRHPLFEPTLCPDGALISIAFYIFNGGYLRFINCVKESIYAYRQLVNYSNILECGRIRFFVDKRCLAHAHPFYEVAGLTHLVVPIETPSEHHMSGFFPLLYHPEVEACEFRFHFDTDNWLLHPEWKTSVETQCSLDFIELTDIWREAKENIYGMPCKKPDWTIRSSFFLDAPMDVSGAIHEMFDDDIPDAIGYLLETPHDVLHQEKDTLSQLRCASGTCVGIHRNSEAANLMKHTYDRFAENMPGDEGFLTLLLAKHSEVDVFPVIMTGLPNVTSINKRPVFSLLEDFPQTSIVDIGGHDVMYPQPKYAAPRNLLFKYFGEM